MAGSHAWAQPEAYNWRFGVRAGLRFGPSGPPSGVVVPNSPPSFFAHEGSAVLSDEEGNLQCYTDGERVYNREGGLMGVLPSGNRESATHGALLLRIPGDVHRCYLFTVDQEGNFLQGGLRYTVLDLRLNNGLGGFTSVLDQSVPTPPTSQLLTEKLTAVRHANGRDYWVLVHGYNDDFYYAYLLSPAGLAAVPVVSRAGRIHSDSSGVAPRNSSGYLRATPDGRHIAAAIHGRGVDFGSFDAATGRVSNVRALPLRVPYGYYGLEFSADNTKLYVSAEQQRFFYQVDVATLVVTSLPLTGNFPGALARGPDGKIYFGFFGALQLGVIHEPNQLGVNCRLEEAVVPLWPGNQRLGLPNFPNAFAATLRILGPRRICAGNSASFRARLSSSEVLTGGQWDFGDPASGAANTAAGLAAQHTYRLPGTYQVTFTARSASGTEFTATETIIVEEPAVVRISPAAPELCADALNPETLVLSVPELAGASYRWQDGSTASSLEVRGPGRYVVQVTSAGGCISRDSVQVQGYVCQLFIPNIITPNNDEQNERFVLKGLVASEWSCRIFNRWGRLVFQSASYADNWAAAGQPDGVYYYQLVSLRTGQIIKGNVEVVR